MRNLQEFWYEWGAVIVNFAGNLLAFVCLSITMIAVVFLMSIVAW